MKTLFALTLLVGMAAAVPVAAESLAVRYSDLNLARAEGRAMLNARLKAAARYVCTSGGRELSVLVQEAACRSEALAKARGTAEQIAAAQSAAAQLAGR